MSDFKIGDMAWVPRVGGISKSVTCPVCCGKFEVGVILGNGDIYYTSCEYCRGQGIVTEYEHSFAADPFPINEIHRCETDKGVTWEYQSECWRVCEVYATKAEALVKAKIMYDEAEAKETPKSDLRKSYSWNAGYHLREAKRLQRDAEYHLSKMKLCKERAKAKNAEGG